MKLKRRDLPQRRIVCFWLRTSRRVTERRVHGILNVQVPACMVGWFGTTLDKMLCEFVDEH
jgi:hypothetical protein